MAAAYQSAQRSDASVAWSSIDPSLQVPIWASLLLHMTAMAGILTYCVWGTNESLQSFIRRVENRMILRQRLKITLTSVALLVLFVYPPIVITEWTSTAREDRITRVSRFHVFLLEAISRHSLSTTVTEKDNQPKYRIDLSVGMLGMEALAIISSCAALLWCFREGATGVTNSPPAPLDPPASSGPPRRLMEAAVSQEGARPRNTELRQRLRLITLGDEEKVDRMISFEKERNPHANLEALMQYAIERWERDNR
jgi:hypothetical protein